MKLRHKTTTAVIGGTQWNEDHVAPVHAIGDLGAAITFDLANGVLQTGNVNVNVTARLPVIPTGQSEHLRLLLTNGTGGIFAVTFEQPGPADDSGTADSGSSVGAVNDATKSWTVDQWVGYFVRIVAGTGAGQVREIMQNYSAQLIVNPANFDVSPDVTSQYEIFQYDPITWLHGEAPGSIDTATGARNAYVFIGADGAGWIADGGKA